MLRKIFKKKRMIEIQTENSSYRFDIKYDSPEYQAIKWIQMYSRPRIDIKIFDIKKLEENQSKIDQVKQLQLYKN
jgi:hypothetical protein